MLNPTEDIKSRLDIVEIIREYVPQLKQTGANWRACCPFHNEKTPSFMVSQEKQIFKCFGCGEGGDIFNFVMKIEGVEFPETLRSLAKRAGVTLPDFKENPQMANQKSRVLDILNLSAKYFQYILEKANEAKIARDYLEKRKVKPETLKEFVFGYSLDSWDGLIKFLKSRKFNDNEIFLAGLSVKNDRGGYYDRFRGRLMFPIWDLHGSVVGFTARILKTDDKQGKYINTPQTNVYDKSSIIYGLNFAKLHARQEKKIILVEGQMDCITSHEAGIKNVVATSGTALTDRQIKLLKRYASELLFSFDADSAGQEAAKRAIDTALANDVNVRIIQIPQGKDPDECIKHNLNDWKGAIESAKPIMEYYFKTTFKDLDLTKAQDKKQAAKELLTIITKISNKIEQTHWLQELSNKLNVSESVLRESIERPRRRQFKTNTPPPEYQKKEIVKDNQSMLIRQILALGIKLPQNLEFVFKNLEEVYIKNQVLGEFYKNFKIYYNRNTTYPQKKLTKNDQEIFAELELLADKEFHKIDEETAKREIENSLKTLKKDFIKSERKKIELDFKEVEHNKEKYPDYQEKIKNFNKKFSELARAEKEIE